MTTLADLHPVLLIAPDTGYDWQEGTVRNLSVNMRPVIVAGHVTYADAQRSLREGQWGCVTFLGHGTKEGIIVQPASKSAEPGTMAGMTLLSRDALPGLIRLSRAKLVILATCQSVEIGLWIAEQANVTVICTVGAIGMREAYETLATFAGLLAQGLTVDDAFAAARTSQDWKMFAAPHSTHTDNLTLQILRAVDMATAPLRDQLSDIQQDVNKRIDGLEEKVEGLEKRIPPRNLLRFRAYIIGIWCLTMPSLLYLPEVREAVGIKTFATIGFVLSSWALAVLLVTYGNGWLNAELDS